MRISSAAVIFSTYPIVASMISIFYLKKKASFIQVFTYLACFFSVILTAKPVFIFPTNDKNEDTSFGIFLAVISSIFNAIGTLLNKPISFDFDVTMSTYCYGSIFSSASFALGISSGNFMKGIVINELSFILVLLLGLF